MAFNGTPIMTYGLTGILIAVLTRALFIPESTINIPKYDFTDTFAQLSVPSFVPALAAAVPIPAIFSPSSELSKSVSDMLSPKMPEIFQKSNEENPIAVESVAEIETPQAINIPETEVINPEPVDTDEQELGLKGGKNRKKRKTRKYRVFTPLKN